MFYMQTVLPVVDRDDAVETAQQHTLPSDSQLSSEVCGRSS
jgi:hypothetical protein